MLTMVSYSAEGSSRSNDDDADHAKASESRVLRKIKERTGCMYCTLELDWLPTWASRNHHTREGGGLDGWMEIRFIGKKKPAIRPFSLVKEVR